MTNRCFICGEDNKNVLQRHHIVPRRHGGSDATENLVDLCASCHQAVEKIYNKRFYRRLKDTLSSQTTAPINASDPHTTIKQVYTAGAMSGKDSGTLGWRRSFSPKLFPGIQFLHPTDVELPHGTGTVTGCVAADFEMLLESDGIIAYFSKPEQPGTLTELMYALSHGKPALVVFDTSLLEPLMAEPEEREIPQQLKPANAVEMAWQSPYWFVINTLAGDPNADSEIRERHSGLGTPWQGVDLADVYVADRAHLSDLCEQWLIKHDSLMPSKFVQERRDG